MAEDKDILKEISFYIKPDDQELYYSLYVGSSGAIDSLKDAIFLDLLITEMASSNVSYLAYQMLDVDL